MLDSIIKSKVMNRYEIYCIPLFYRGEIMARIGRLVVKNEQAVYHVMSRTALDGSFGGRT